MHCFCILFLKRLFSCGLMLVLMNIEELYTHVSACRELYVQDILCSVIYSMLHTIECCLAGGKFKEYSKTICELKVIKVKWWPVIFVHFQGVPLVWARDEWCSCKDRCRYSLWQHWAYYQPVCLTTVKGKMPPWSFKSNVTYWRACFGIFTAFCWFFIVEF